MYRKEGGGVGKKRKSEKRYYTAGPAALSSSESGKKSLVQSSILSIFSRVDARTLKLSTPDISCLLQEDKDIDPAL